MALLRGSLHISVRHRAGQRLSQKQRAHIGLRRRRGTKFYPAPYSGVYRDLLGKLDVKKMSEIFNLWLDEHEGILPRSLAMDGKTIVHGLGQMVSLVDQKDGVPVAMVCNDEGKELPWDGVAFGSLKVRGPWICSGYYKSEGSDAHIEPGWFETGDVATIDPQGYMAITDRTKDVIKSGGEWISSIEVENTAMGHPGVAEAAFLVDVS